MNYFAIITLSILVVFAGGFTLIDITTNANLPIEKAYALCTDTSVECDDYDSCSNSGYKAGRCN
jgi:hypothetical protein